MVVDFEERRGPGFIACTRNLLIVIVILCYSLSCSVLLEFCKIKEHDET